MKRIAERVAVVTGAGSGIGRAVSLALAGKGADLALVDIDEVGLAEVEADIAALGRRASSHLVDVSSRQQMAALPDQVLAEHGSVEILVNNAGVSVSGPFDELDVDDLEWITGINYWGVVYGCRYFLPHLRRSDEAHIVNMSSFAGFTGMQDQGSYAATKFAVRGLSECLYVELAKTPVGITCVHPGAVATDILESSRADPELKQKMDVMFRFAMQPDKAARLIVRAVERDRFKLVFCAESRMLDVMKRLAPIGTLKLMRLARRGTASARPR